MSDGRHDLGIALVSRRMRDHRIVIERMPQVTEGRALDDRELLEQNASLIEQRDDFRRACVCRNLVSADLDARAQPIQPQIELDGPSVGHCPLSR